MQNLTKLSLITATVIGLSGCGGGDSTPSTPTTNTQSKITLRVSDAKAGFLKEDVELKFSGVAVTDVNGNAITQLSLLKDSPNKIELYIQTPPSQTKDLRIVANSDQYLATGTSLLVRPTQQDYAINLKMVEEKVGKVTQGVYLNEMDISSMVDATGKVTQEIILESNPGAAISTKIKIPVNTILLDKDGNPILNATLKVTGFDPSSSKALEAYPGGLNVMADATGFNGNGTANQEINFKTAGFVAIEIAGDNNKRVKTFSQDVEIAMQFKVGTTNGDGNVVQAGDPVPIWSYDEETGKWTYEKVGTAQINTTDNTLMDVVYTITHLSYYNLDWHYGNVCSSNINVIDSNNINALNSVDHFTIDIPGANLFRTVNPWGSTANGDLIVYNVPAGYQGTVTAYDANGLLLGSVGPTDLCGGQVGTGGWTGTNYDNEVDLTVDDDTTDVNVSMTFSCPNNVNIPGFNSSSIPFSAVLTNVGNISTQLSNAGTGTVSVSNSASSTYDVTATTAQSNLFAVIDSSNSQNPVNNQITLNSSNTNVSQDFVLTNAFCNPLSGQINGVNGVADCGLTDSVSFALRPKDVVKSSNGDIYISSTSGGILKSTGGVSPFVPFIAQSNNSATMPTANPTSSQDEASEVTVIQARGLDIVRPINNPNLEVLIYADKGGHCVNMVDLHNNQYTVVTIAGICGVQGDTSSTSNTPIDSRQAKLNNPYDVAYDVNNDVLFISDVGNHKVKMLQNNSNSANNNYIWTVAGDGSTAGNFPANSLPDALTTAINPFMLDVDSQGQVVFSDRSKHRITRIEGINHTANDPAATAELRHMAGRLNGQTGATGDGALAVNAKLYRPIDIEIDASDNIFIAAKYNHKIRRIDALTNIIDTVAGTGSLANPTQCGQATSQNIRAPYGLWVEGNGDFYFIQSPTANSTFNSLRHVTY